MNIDTGVQVVLVWKHGHTWRRAI